MNRDDIIRMAYDAGMTWEEGFTRVVGCVTETELERFARLVYEKAWYDTALAATRTVTDAAIALEREACAKLCKDSINLQPYPTLTEMAAAIRARGNS